MANDDGAVYGEVLDILRTATGFTSSPFNIYSEYKAQRDSLAITVYYRNHERVRRVDFEENAEALNLFKTISEAEVYLLGRTVQAIVEYEEEFEREKNNG